MFRRDTVSTSVQIVSRLNSLNRCSYVRLSEQTAVHCSYSHSSEQRYYIRLSDGLNNWSPSFSYLKHSIKPQATKPNIKRFNHHHQGVGGPVLGKSWFRNMGPSPTQHPQPEFVSSFTLKLSRPNETMTVFILSLADQLIQVVFRLKAEKEQNISICLLLFS